ncbi:hypothetical protein, partial [Mycoplasmopsis cricetuli]|uniref:hypothetical protein n=1 Tax=Mycoplasmopsis cricetuli TaxID=171283 RepID=UPI000560AB8C
MLSKRTNFEIQKKLKEHNFEKINTSKFDYSKLKILYYKKNWNKNLNICNQFRDLNYFEKHSYDSYEDCDYWVRSRYDDFWTPNKKAKWDFYILKTDKLANNNEIELVNSYQKWILKKKKIENTSFYIHSIYSGATNKHTIVQIERTSEDRQINVMLYPSEYAMWLYGYNSIKEKQFRKKLFKIFADILGYDQNFQEKTPIWGSDFSICIWSKDTEEIFNQFIKANNFKKQTLNNIFANYSLEPNNYDELINDPFADLVANLTCQIKNNNNNNDDDLCLLSRWVFDDLNYLDFFIVPNQFWNFEITENEFTKQIILHKDLSLKLKTDDFKKNFYKSIQEE